MFATKSRTRTLMLRHCILSALLLSLASVAGAADPLEIKLIYLEEEPDRKPVFSNLVLQPEDEGLQGATAGIADNNTTGKFLKQSYSIENIVIGKDDDIIAAAKVALAGPQLVVANMSASKLAAIADLPQAQDDLIFNAGSSDTWLRDEGCRANVLHTMPSRAMLTDALMQFFNKRKWDSVFLLTGNRDVDALYAESVKRSAKKYRVSIDPVSYTHLTLPTICSV